MLSIRQQARRARSTTLWAQPARAAPRFSRSSHRAVSIAALAVPVAAARAAEGMTAHRAWLLGVAVSATAAGQPGRSRQRHRARKMRRLRPSPLRCSLIPAIREKNRDLASRFDSKSTGSQEFRRIFTFDPATSREFSGNPITARLRPGPDGGLCRWWSNRRVLTASNNAEGSCAQRLQQRRRRVLAKTPTSDAREPRGKARDCTPSR